MPQSLLCPTHPSTAPQPTWWRQRSTLLSGALHLALLLAILGGWHWGPHLAPYRMPGTTQGVRTLTYFSAGRPQPSTTDAPALKTATKKLTPKPDPKAASAPVETAAAPQADLGPGSSAKSGAGEGNLNIALPKVFPYPNADISALPRGSSGDVILNAVIDEQGKITELTLVKGLGPQIDNKVLATVQGWSYAPATKDGVPVRSEQELRFHYERRG